MSAEPVRHRFTVDEYYQMGEAGLFAPDQRLELLGGEVIEMAPIGSRHASAVIRLNRLVMIAVGDRAIVGIQSPVRLSELSELQPDLTVLRWRPDFYRMSHPTPDDVLLVVEVSDTTARWDRKVKRPFYSAAGIGEMWIIDLGLNLVEVATDPGVDDYRDIRQVSTGSIAPIGLPDLSLVISDLLA
jgi:Uma2 family endonuclease